MQRQNGRCILPGKVLVWVCGVRQLKVESVSKHEAGQKERYGMDMVLKRCKEGDNVEFQWMSLVVTLCLFGFCN